MAYNGKGVDMADITRQKATANEAYIAAKKTADLNKKMFGNHNRVGGDGKARNNKSAILKEQMTEFSQLSRSDERDKEGLDPYSFKSPSKLKAVDKLALKEAGYTNTLLTQIIKNQSNPANLQAEIQYRDNVLNLLKEIRDNTTKDTNKKTDLRNGKVYETKTRKTSSLAEAVLGGDFGGILKNIARSSEMGGMGLELYEGLKDAIDTFKDPMMLKQSIKGAVLNKAISTLPKELAEHLNRFKEDAGTYIQDMINQMAYGKNVTLRGLTRGSHQAVKFDPSSAGKTDMSKEALFDNKFYTAVTFEIPSVLYSIRDGINKTIGDRYDYDKQEWTSLLADIRDMTQSSQSITNGVDQMMRNLSILSEKAIGTTGGVSNTNMSQIFSTDKNGNVKKDANNRMKYQHETLMRQLLTAFINEGIDSNTLINVDPHALISGKGLSKYIAKDYHDLLPQVILGLSDIMKGVSYDERSEFDNKRESIINTVERNLVKNKEKLASYSPRDIQAMTQFVQGSISTREFENITGLSVEAFGNKNNGVRGNTETVRNTTSTKEKTTTSVITTKEQLSKVLSDPVPSINALKNIDTDLWKSLTDNQKMQINSIIGRGTIGVTTSKMVDNLLANDISSSVKTLNVEAREELLKKQREDVINALMNRGGITNKALKERYFKNELTDEDNKALDSQIDKYMIANKYFSKMHNANMTATAMAHYVGMGAKASDYERLGFLSDPAQLVPFIKDDGTLNISKLQSQYSKYNESMMMSIEREDRRVRVGEVFDVATPLSSFNKILTNIFSDAKVSRNIGVIGGGAAGYAIGKLLQTQGVVESPALARMMGVVGSVAMMFSSNREKIQNILGPEGEYKNENGVTNRQIFMAKFINKWLPSIGLGGKVGSMTMKAFKAFGPLGVLVSPFFGLTTGLIAGAMAPSILRIAQRKLFDDDGKGNKGILKKVGNFLKKFDFIKKYFNIRDNRTDVEIEHDTVRNMIRALEKDNERYSKVIEDPESTEVERTEAFKKIADNEKRIFELKSFDEELSIIEEDANATDEEKKNSRERAKKLLTGQNQEAYKLREKSAKESRDRSQKGKALHDMDFITKRDMYEASKGKIVERKASDIDRQYISDKSLMSEYIKDYNEGNFDNITDKGAFNIIDKAKKDGRYTDEAIAMLLDNYYSKARKKKAQEADLAMRQYIDSQVFDSNGKQVMTDRQVLMDRASEYINVALKKQAYDRAVKNGKILLPSEIVGYQKMKEFSEIMQNENLSSIEKEKAIKEWYESLPEEKRTQIDTVLTLRQNIAEGLKNTSEDYIQYLSYTNPMLADRPAQLISRAMFDIREVVALEKFKNNLRNLKGIASDSFDRFLFETIEGGYIADDSRTRGRSEQIISSLMTMKYANEQTGGEGTDVKGNVTDTNGTWRMLEFSDLKFANGKPVSVAGCALGAFNAAIMKHNFPPISASAMMDVANEYLSEDGINMDFFKAMAERIGWTAVSYKISENTFTPQNIKSILTQSGTSAILQLQNIDNNGSHYVTLLNYGPKKCQICDPEMSTFKTEILTGDIIARLISITVLTVLTKPSDVALRGDKTESSSEKAKKKVKEAFKSALKGSAVGSAVLGAYNLTKWGMNKYRGNNATPADIAASIPKSSDSKIEDPVAERLSETVEKLNDVINVRIVGDDTIALTNTDTESSKSALQLSMLEAKDSKSRRRITKIRQLFNKPSFQRDQLKKEAVEDAILNGTAAGISNMNNTNSRNGGINTTGVGNGESWTVAKWLIGNKLASFGGSVLTWLKTSFVGLLGESLIAALQTLGIFASILAASKLLGWLVEKVFGIKKDNIEAQQRSNDAMTSEYVDVNGRTLKEGTKENMKNAKKPYILTDEWYAYAKSKVEKGDLERDTMYYTRKGQILEPYASTISNVDTSSKWRDKEFDIKYIEAERAKLEDEAKKKYLKDNPESKEDGKIKDPRVSKDPNYAKGDGGDEGAITNLKKIVGKFVYPDLYRNFTNYSNTGNSGQTRLLMGEGTGDFKSAEGLTDSAEIIKAVAKATGVDENLMLGIAYQESRLVANAGAKGSSAKGLFQFVDGTWKSAVNAYASKAGLDPKLLVKGMGTKNDPRFNPVWNSIIAAYYIADMYKMAKKDLGRDPLPEEVYIYHGFGPGGAKYFLSRKDNEDAVAVTVGSSIKNYPNTNRAWFYNKDGSTKTVAGTKEFFKQKVGLYFEDKKLGGYNSAFGLKDNPVFDEKNLSSDIVKGESVPANLVGMMKALPVKGSKSQLVVTSAFGPRNTGIPGASTNHKGIDIRAYQGDPIFATNDGNVDRSEKSYGLVHITDPTTGIASRYLHLSKRLVKPGDKVKAGQLIGYSGGIGKSGNKAFDAHLHYEVHDKPNSTIDPFKVLGLQYENLNPSSPENIKYAKRNKLKSIKEATKEARMNQSLEKGDGPISRPYTHVASGVPSYNGGNSDSAIMNLITMLAKSINSLMQTNSQTNGILNDILSYMKTENRNKSIMSDARQIARSEL